MVHDAPRGSANTLEVVPELEGGEGETVALVLEFTGFARDEFFEGDGFARDALASGCDEGHEFGGFFDAFLASELEETHGHTVRVCGF